MRRRRLSTRFFISMGLVSLLLSAMLLGLYGGVVPDTWAAMRLGRIALAESIAASTSTLVAQSEATQAEAIRKLRDGGFKMIDHEPRTWRNSRYAFLHPGFLNGVLVEVIDEKP